MIFDVVRLRSRAEARVVALAHAACGGVATLACGLLLVACVLLLGGIAEAQEQTLTVQPGSTTVIAAHAEAIAVTSPTLPLPVNQGRLVIVAGQGTPAVQGAPAVNVLAYLAPPLPAGADPISINVTYTVAGRALVAHVTVTNQAVPAAQSAWGDVYGPAFKVLFILFVLATIIESGLAVIFNWRVFIEVFDARGAKTVVSIVVSALFVAALDLDVTTSLYNVYNSTSFAPMLPGKVLTTLVLAGGSSGVNNLLIALGFRSVRQPDQVVPRPPRDQAWVSVRLKRDKAKKGPVTVLIGEPNGNALPVAGTILGESSRRGILGYFIRDPGRFPTAGGYAIHLPYAVQPGAVGVGGGPPVPVPVPTEIKIRLEWTDEGGNKIPSPEWGPYKVAPAAIIDIELKL